MPEAFYMTEATVAPPASAVPGKVIEPDSRWRRFRKFVCRHDTVLTVTGSFVILLSFGLREELEASLREQLSTLRSAQYLYQQRIDEGDALHDIAGKMQVVYQKMQSPKTNLSYDDFEKTDFEHLNETFATISEFYSDAEIDEDDEDHRAINKFGQDLEKANPKGRPHLNTIQDRARSPLRTLERSIDGIRTSVEKHADEIENAKIYKLKVVGFVGVVVFLLGWLVSLASKLIGKKDDEV
jgi:hypothetical protein